MSPVVVLAMDDGFIVFAVLARLKLSNSNKSA